MNQDLKMLKTDIVRLIKLLENNEWCTADIIIQFPPFINKGLTTLPSFFNVEQERVRLFLNYDESFQKNVYSFIVKHNQENSYNQIIFKTIKEDYESATIEISFNQEVEDSFRNNLPKSWRKKTIIPWWKNPDETKGLE